MRSSGPPPGYVAIEEGLARAVVREALAGSVRHALRTAPKQNRTLFGFAGSTPGALALAGRGTAYSFALPQSSIRLVVRHNRHGGALAWLTGDRFLAPTRAPHELKIALELERRGVPTPDVIAYVMYPAGPGFRRADVATAEVESSRDLGALLVNGTKEDQTRAWIAVRELLGRLAGAGAHHEDLNAKNILLRSTGTSTYEALLIDVDRVVFRDGDVAWVRRKNAARLARSVRKLGRTVGATVNEQELASL